MRNESNAKNDYNSTFYLVIKFSKFEFESNNNLIDIKLKFQKLKYFFKLINF
jgi:hypothetical protein